ncbi:MAG: hypothetical protein ABS70_00325 [Nitrospira sp. SCN 59-13]|nr:MAG: hypothetical protein ABS70_00325 [Nitrospira sp. SCN 59-13]
MQRPCSHLRIVAGLLYGVFVAAAPALAVPIKNPDNCQGPVTIGVATCPDKPGHWVECTPGGDYMCCVANAQGGKDCEQIETLKGPRGGMTRVPGGMLQNAPVVSPAPINPRLPRAGMNAPIMRRGVDGEPADSTPTAPDDKNK